MNQNRNNSDPNFKLSGSDWLQALKELEGTAPAASPGPLRPVRALTPLPLRPTPVQESEVPKIVEELLSGLEDELEKIRRFVSAHPYLIAPNVHRMWEDNLRETAVMVQRHFDRWKAAQEQEGNL